MRLRQLRPVGQRVPTLSLAEVVSAGRDSGSALQRIGAAAGIDDRYNVHWLDSATAALAVVLRACADLRGVARPEVIVPAFACPDIVAAAVHAGVQPVLADFMPQSSQLDPRDVLAAMTPRTVAVIGVRLLGLPGNTAELRRTLGADCPVLIDDCAHVLPANALRTDADAIVLSFGRGKPVSVRRGGALIVKRDSSLDACCAVPAPTRLSKTAALIHYLSTVTYNRAISPRVYWLLTRVARLQVDAIAYRTLQRVHGFPADLAAPLLKAMDRDHTASSTLASAYAQLLKTTRGPWLDLAASTAGLWRYPLLLKTAVQRDRLHAVLWRAGLGPSRLYRQTLSGLSETAIHVRARAHPNAQLFAERLLTLPLHEDVAAGDIENIRECLQAFAASTTHPVAVNELRPFCT